METTIHLIRRKSNGHVGATTGGELDNQTLGYGTHEAVATYKGEKHDGLLARSMFLAGVEWARRNPNEPIK